MIPGPDIYVPAQQVDPTVMKTTTLVLDEILREPMLPYQKFYLPILLRLENKFDLPGPVETMIFTSLGDY
jgi:hypothetical protein